MDVLHHMIKLQHWLHSHERATGKPAAYWSTQQELSLLYLHPRWREEAPDSGTFTEYAIRIARAVGLHASDDGMGGLHIRRTTGPIDEETITWPGRGR